MDLPLLANDLGNDVYQAFEGFILKTSQVAKLKSTFMEELDLGMKHGLEKSSLQMENTFVPELIDGSESGIFLALDLGGTNFRVLLFELKNGKVVKEAIKYYSVSETLRLGPGIDLFDYLATCIKDFLESSVDALGDQSTLPLGFTFSFPMTQIALDKGALVAWTKSFNCSGVVGEDAARLLAESLQKLNLKGPNEKKLNVKVVAILNDTTGTLMMGSYDKHDTCIGLILGTGANAAYFEQSKNVVRWHGNVSKSKNVIMDPEFGAFGDNGCIDFLKTEVDKEIDANSLFPGSFTYEKYFSGKYLGNILRLLLLKLHQTGKFLPRQLTTLGDQDTLTAEDVSHMVKDLVDTQSDKTRSILSSIITTASQSISSEDVKVAQTASYIISERCAILVAVPLAVFLERIDRSEGETSAIAVTGSLYQKHPTIKDSLEKYTKQWTTNKSNIYTFLSEDGSGKGAALVAAIASRMNGSS